MARDPTKGSRSFRVSPRDSITYSRYSIGSGSVGLASLGHRDQPSRNTLQGHLERRFTQACGTRSRYSRAGGESARARRALAADCGHREEEPLDPNRSCATVRTRPRMNGLLRGRVSRFSLDVLVNIATAIGRRVHMEWSRSNVTASCRRRFERSTRGLIATCSNGANASQLLARRQTLEYQRKIRDGRYRPANFCYIFEPSAGMDARC